MNQSRFKRFPKRVLKWLFLSAWLGLIVSIFYVSSRPIPSRMCNYPDWLLHGLCYAVLTYLTCNAASQWEIADGKKLIMLSIAFSIIYGMSDEFHQSFVPFRHASWYDVAADSVGAQICGFALCFQKTFKLNRTTGETNYG